MFVTKVDELAAVLHIETMGFAPTIFTCTAMRICLIAIVRHPV